jgi:hypothetical protein
MDNITMPQVLAEILEQVNVLEKPLPTTMRGGTV